MVDVKHRKFKTKDCGKKSFGVAGTTSVDYCAQHALDGMVDVNHRKCKTEGCCKKPSFRVAGMTTVECCAQHAPDGRDGRRRMRKENY